MKTTFSHFAAVGFIALGTQAVAAPLLQEYNFKQDVNATISQTNAWLEISKSAFKQNIEFVKSRLSKGSSLCAVMKADAYGHGIALLIPTIMEAGINCIGIASNEEARIARKEGYTGKIIRVRQATEGEIVSALPYDIEELIGNAQVAQAISTLAEHNGKPIKIHLVTNAGAMSRNGLELATEQGKKDVLEITSMKGLKVTGIMTHFAVEDKAFVMEAYDKFMSEQDWIIKTAHLNRDEITVHCANSFATLDVPATHLDMVRVGGALYGDLIGRAELKRVMSLKSKVAAVNTYPAGNTVGYDRTLTLTRDSRLANIPVGYSDGYRRVFTNKSFVVINGVKVPTVGKISMNTVMVDVTDIKNVKPGDTVTLYGKQGDAEITQAELEDINNGALLADVYTMWGISNIRILVD